MLLSVIPLPWRLLAYVGAAAALIGFGYVKGMERGQAKLDAFTTKVSEIAHQQGLRTAREIGKREAITELLAQEHEDEIDRMRARNADLARRLHDSGSRPLVVPAVSHPAGRPDGEACYNADALERGIRGHLDRAAGRLAGLLQRSDEAVMLQALCSRWLNEQLKVEK